MSKRMLLLVLTVSVGGCLDWGVVEPGDGSNGDELCNYETDRLNASCDGGWLIYCGDDNYWASVECGPYCLDYYGDPSVSGSCGFSEEMRAINCLCVFPDCDHTPYCADGLRLVQCNVDASADEYVDCNVYCIGIGYPRGTCDVDACLCG